MKRLRSSEDLDSYAKDPNPNPIPRRTSSSSSHRSFSYYNNGKPDTPRSAASSRPYDRAVRKRPPPPAKEHEVVEERRKGVDRYNGGGGGDRSGSMHRSESFSGGSAAVGFRRTSEFPKGFRSERDRPSSMSSAALRCEESSGGGSVMSWRRFGKEFEEAKRSNSSGGGGGGFRDVRSSPPLLSWSNSKDSGGGSGELSRVRSPQPRPRRFQDGKSSKSTTSKSKSPTWSKDSVGSEQSKSVEVKKTEPEPKKPKKEIAPEPEPETESNPVRVPEPEIEPHAEAVGEEVEVDGESESRVSSEMEEGELEPEVEAEPKVVAAETEDVLVEVRIETEVTVTRENDVLLDSVDAMDDRVCDEGKEEEDKKQEELAVVDETRKVGKEEDDERTESDREVTEEEDNGVQTLNLSAGLTRSFKDNGKSVVNAEDSGENSGWGVRGSRELLTGMDNDMEGGPSTRSRGFDLFTSSPVRRQGRADSGLNVKDEKLVLEPLDLSLSLPNVLLPIGATPGSPDQATSVRSLTNTFCTNSEGFTQSVSFSGSPSFYHNPSCSLTTQNSMDFEQSVKSRPLFKGIDWQALAQNEPTAKEGSFYQKTLVTSNDQPPSGVKNDQSVQGQRLKHPEGSSKEANGFERQLSFHKQLSGGHPKLHEDVRSPAHSAGSHEMGSNYSFDRKRLMREKSSSSLYRTSNQKENEQLLIGGADFLETIIARIVSDPVLVMAKKFHDMAGHSAACMKESVREIMLNADKRMQLSAFQKALQRSDITLEMLLKAHRAQLEILVALKTGLPEFLQQESSVSSSDLAEIFLCLRCRNPSCRSPVPVDECDCKVCSPKTGFCSSCMCLVCSKFDMASNTCSWIGCAVCLHWCHADCALRESYIRNGCSATGSQGTTEMQFHCVACDHPSEMFGFVKEVFQNFAKDWTIENLARELEYVKRIFVVSKDMRGRQLYEIADQSLARLANKSGLPEVYSYIIAFLLAADANSSKLGKTPILSGKDQVKGDNSIAGPSQEPAWLKSVYTEKAPQLESAPSILPSFNYDQLDKRTVMESEMHMRSHKEPVFDELESIVRIKQVEAKMFQTRADEARKEAEELKRIALAKNEKIEEEYRSIITKLRFTEAEELRKQKLEELQALDRAHREYSNMKMQMESNIKDLLLKMEATKRNLSS